MNTIKRVTLESPAGRGKSLKKSDTFATSNIHYKLPR
jgi:hypothetical protein